MLWLANLPDLNIIEKAWFYIKKEITKRGLISNKRSSKQDRRNTGKTYPKVRFKSGSKQFLII
jgi:hypothetical protein